MSHTLEKSKNRKGKGRFLLTPVNVLECDDYLSLSLAAKVVLTIIHHKYTGRNNGDLSCPLSESKKWGIKHPGTLAKALKELQDADLIRRTRDPTLMRTRKSPHGQCSLFAITWESLDDIGSKIDAKPTIAPLRNFSQKK